MFPNESSNLPEIEQKGSHRNSEMSLKYSSNLSQNFNNVPKYRLKHSFHLPLFIVLPSVLDVRPRSEPGTFHLPALRAKTLHHGWGFTQRFHLLPMVKLWGWGCHRTTKLLKSGSFQSEKASNHSNLFTTNKNQ